MDVRWCYFAVTSLSICPSARLVSSAAPWSGVAGRCIHVSTVPAFSLLRLIPELAVPSWTSHLPSATSARSTEPASFHVAAWSARCATASQNATRLCHSWSVVIPPSLAKTSGIQRNLNSVTQRTTSWKQTVERHG